MTKMFTCAICGKRLESDWTDEQARERLAKEFPGFSPDECDEVCEDCHTKVVAWLYHTPEGRKAMEEETRARSQK